MEINITNWDGLTTDEKKRKLYEKQKATLDSFLAHGAITKAQYDKSLGDLSSKMGIELVNHKSTELN